MITQTEQNTYQANFKSAKKTYVVPQSVQTKWLPTADCDISFTDDDVISVVNSAPSAGGLGEGVGRDGEEAGRPGDGRGPLR